MNLQKKIKFHTMSKYTWDSPKLWGPKQVLSLSALRPGLAYNIKQSVCKKSNQVDT